MKSRYVPRRPEPPSTNVDDTFSCARDIAAELERIGRPRMAKWVASMDADITRANRLAMDYLAKIVELERQLPQYQREKAFDPTPPPEASD